MRVQRIARIGGRKQLFCRQIVRVNIEGGVQPGARVPANARKLPRRGRPSSGGKPEVGYMIKTQDL